MLKGGSAREEEDDLKERSSYIPLPSYLRAQEAGDPAQKSGRLLDHRPLVRFALHLSDPLLHRQRNLQLNSFSPRRSDKPILP